MLTSAIVVLRAAAVVMSAVILLTSSPESGATRVAQISCLAVGAATLIVWAVIAQRRGPVLHDGRLAVLFAVMAAASAATTSPRSGTLVLFAIIAALAAGESTRLIGGWAVTGVAFLAISTGAALAGAPVSTTISYCGAVLMALLLGHTRRSYRVQAEQSAMLLAQSDLLREEQSQVDTLKERARIAREIHDVLAHSLGALGIQIQAARALLSDQQDAHQALAVLNRAQRIATEGLDETRRAVHALRTDSRPLDQELAALATAHQTSHRVPVVLTVNGPVLPLAPDAGLALLRTAQESLVNAAKHSPGQPIEVELHYSPTETHLQVHNPLPATAALDQLPDIETVGGGFGLIGMRERLLLLHGTLTACARAGRWEVIAQVPR